MRNYGNSFLDSIPAVTRNLLIINLLVWFAQIVLPRIGIDVEAYLALHYWQASGFNPVQLISYMFLHGDFSHIFFNMFSLWMFGRILEHVMGQKRFLFYYISCGLGAAIIQELVWTMTWRSDFIPALANLNAVSIEQMTMYVDQALAAGEEYGSVLRAKGIVPSTEDGVWLHFDLTPEEYQIRHGSADYTGRICVIGTGLAEDKLPNLFGLA